MREAPHFVALIHGLRTTRPEGLPFPQVFIIDGNGRLHERQAGLATVVGVQAGVATIGCAKDYHPICFENGDTRDWLRSQKGFKHMCKSNLQTRGDWIGIQGVSSDQPAGAVGLYLSSRKATEWLTSVRSGSLQLFSRPRPRASLCIVWTPYQPGGSDCYHPCMLSSQ